MVGRLAAWRGAVRRDAGRDAHGALFAPVFAVALLNEHPSAVLLLKDRHLLVLLFQLGLARGDGAGVHVLRGRLGGAHVKAAAAPGRDGAHLEHKVADGSAVAQVGWDVGVVRGRAADVGVARIAFAPVAWATIAAHIARPTNTAAVVAVAPYAVDVDELRATSQDGVAELVAADAAVLVDVHRPIRLRHVVQLLSVRGREQFEEHSPCTGAVHEAGASGVEAREQLLGRHVLPHLHERQLAEHVHKLQLFARLHGQVRSLAGFDGEAELLVGDGPVAIVVQHDQKVAKLAGREVGHHAADEVAQLRATQCIVAVLVLLPEDLQQARALVRDVQHQAHKDIGRH
mmetsp:Transcript_14319/g.36693  ORF Transcript_14319/g.36693 Transcript_14319/m.36693 type:complete len:344 (-) Transcript_14319:389-1420(-)